MKKFIIRTYEQEAWVREYIIKAKNEDSAEKKFWNGEYEECTDGECTNESVDIENIEEVDIWAKHTNFTEEAGN